MPKKLTRKLAIEYMCHHCTGYYDDGKQDCGCIVCPLYSFMKYAKKEPDLSFTKFNPSRVGRVTWEDSSRDLTDKQREDIAIRLNRRDKTPYYQLLEHIQKNDRGEG